MVSGIGRRRAAAKVDKAPNYDKRRKEISENLKIELEEIEKEL